MNPIIFNITGPHRKKIHDAAGFSWVDWLIHLILFVCLLIASSSLCFAGVVVSVVWAINQHYIEEYVNMFDGEIIITDGVAMGVAIPTQQKEGELESRNFVVTNDRKKLHQNLDKSKIAYSEDKVVTWSIGSTTGQSIDGQSLAPFSEVEMGVDRFSDEDIEKFLDEHANKLGQDGVVVFMNSAGYGVEEDGGIVYSDNTLEYENILANVVPRTIGGTGSNANAMRFVERAARIHQRNKYNYTLAIVPRGDKSMPQGGSHSKQIVLENFLEYNDVSVIEVSGKQTKRVYIPAGTCSVIESAEKICKCMKETKILDANGNTHGSQRVFG